MDTGIESASTLGGMLCTSGASLCEPVWKSIMANSGRRQENYGSVEGEMLSDS